MSDIAVITDKSIGEELIFDNTAVSKILGVQDSTLRKYCTLMQKYHYQFKKNSAGHRIFYKNDVDVMKNIVDLKNSSTLTLEQAVKTILEVNIADTTANDIFDIATVSSVDNNKIHEEFSTFRKEQMEFNKKLIEQLRRQEAYIKNSIEARDQKLMLSIKESMETRRQVAAVVEKIEETQKNKKAWWQFWK